MGTLNLVIRDDLDEKFRGEVFKRKGMKRGNLTEALEEALELWIDSDVILKLKQKAMKSNTTITEMKDIVDTLQSIGKPAIHALSDLLDKDGLAITEMRKITEAIRQLQF